MGKEMKSLESNATKTIFEQIRREDENGNEYWTARDISSVLEYSEYRHFKPVIEKAKEACQKSNNSLDNHFEDILDMVSLGLGSKRNVENVKLSRYACYLIVQNADPSKEIVAIGQTYFAVQTRLQEIQQMSQYQGLKTENERRLFLRNELRNHNFQLAEAARNSGVLNNVDYAIFQNHGYKGLYGGLDAKGIHSRKELKNNQKILDHMGSTELAANLFRATQTEEKLRRENVKGKHNANKTHFAVGKKVRKTIQELGGTMPEELPTAESIKLLEGGKTNSQISSTVVKNTEQKSSQKTSVKTSVKILELVKGNNSITIPELSQLIGVSERSVERNIKNLQDSKNLKRVGPDKGGHWEVINGG
jgi:DNA-damage-inducible protein D